MESLALGRGGEECERQDSDQNKNDEQSVKDSILQASTPRRVRVWDAGKSDHGVKWQIHTRERGFEQMIEFLFRAKCPRRGFVAHFNEITDRQIGERIGIFFSGFEIFGKSAF